MTPEEFFRTHPELWWASLTGAGGATVFAALTAVQADRTGRRLRYGALAAITGTQTAFLFKLRRSSPA